MSKFKITFIKEVEKKDGSGVELEYTSKMVDRSNKGKKK